MNLLEYIKNPVTGNDIINTAKKVIDSNKDELLKLQKQQWSKGKDKEGNIIGKYKKATEGYANKSPFPNTPKIAGQPYNLDWSGDLKRKTYIESKKSNKDVVVKIDSKGKALSELFETIRNYGLISNPNTIFGYQPQNSDKITKLVTQKTLINLKNRI